MTFLFSLLLVCLSASAGTEGQSAPAFHAQLLNGDHFSLAQAKGKVVVLHFWATWCEACQTEMPALEKLYQKYHSQGLEIVAVNADSPVDPKEVKQQIQKFTFPVALGRESQFKAYGRIWRLPLTFVIDRQGLLKKDGWAQDEPLSFAELETFLLPLIQAKVPGKDASL